MMRLSLTGKRYENETLNVCLTTYKDQSGEILFVGKEVAGGLGYLDTRHAIIQHVDEEDRCRLMDVAWGLDSKPSRKGGDSPPFSTAYHPHKMLINESGLYSLILRSNKPEAKIFQHWVTKEVLPSIRKSGSYALPEVLIAIRGMGLDDVRELDGERRTEFRRESKVRSDLAKDPDKVLLGGIGGKVTQDRIREQRDENQRLHDMVGKLTEENSELKSDIRDIIEFVKDLQEGERLTRV